LALHPANEKAAIRRPTISANLSKGLGRSAHGNPPWV
jgi:hypothetical protein